MHETTVFNTIPEQRPDTPLLDRIETPEQLRSAIGREQLVPLASELRAFLLWSLGQSGGHFGGGLGVVELTLALHYVFNTPEDRLVWDVGHQAYPHKILTQRREQLRSIRSKGGLAAFPSREESHYDTFGVGHSSTSISAALGMALAARIQGRQRKSIAVMGDGAMTAGMAFEALTHAAEERADLLVILNDNHMSISHSVGGLANYFTGMLAPSTLFEEMGFNYIGPIDGHDLPGLLDVLERIRALEGPQFLHVATTKGKGFGPAESDPVGYHAINKIEPLPHLQEPARKPSGPKYSNVFGQWLCDIAERDPRIIGITPAMREGSDLVAFSERFPERYFDVAIAEQHALTLAAGMACDGAKPVVAIYSTFLQRAYDQLIHDLALQNLDVLLAIDRAGQVGEDGPTHAGSFDLTYLRCVPNMVVMAPSNEDETRQMLYTGYCHEGPAAVRYPRGTGPGVDINPDMAGLPLGKGLIRRKGQRVAILAFGSMVQPSLAVAEALGATVADMRFVKPLDSGLVERLAETHELLVTIEENVVSGGAGSGVSEHLHSAGIEVGLLQLGFPDHFIGHGKPAEQLAECGLDAAGIQQSIEARLARLDAGPGGSGASF